METSILHRIRRRETRHNYCRKFADECHISIDLLKRLKLEKELQGHEGCVNCLDWNSSGSLLASGSDDMNVILWDPFTHKNVKCINTGHQGNIFSVKFYPETRDRFVASGAADQHVYVHDVTYNEKIHGFSCHGRVKRLVVSPASPHHLWSASEDGIVREFDIREPSASCSKNLIDLTTMCGENAECKCLAINPVRPDILAVGANDPYVRLYDRRMIKDHTGRVCNGQKRKDNFTLEGCASYFIPGHLQQKYKEYRRRMRCLCATYVTFNSRGNELLVNVGGEQVYLYDLYDNQHSLYQPMHKNPAKKSMNGLNGCTDQNEPHSSNGILIPPATEARDQPDQPSQLPPHIEKLKEQANTFFCKENYTSAIMAYNRAVCQAPTLAVLYGNRAAAYIKRAWDGDMYAALRDCYKALTLNPDYVKASFRLVRCLYELRWLNKAKDCIKAFKQRYPDYAKSRACLALEKDIKSAVKAPSKHQDEPPSNELEVKLQSNAYDYSMRYCGHCNTTTDIKEANFFGNDGQFIIAGSDDGSFFVWERKTANLVRVMHADESIVNCLQPHPTVCQLATSGIDPLVRLWTPSGGEISDRVIEETESVAAENQKRMNTDPLETMLIYMGMRPAGDGNEAGDVIPCRTS